MEEMQHNVSLVKTNWADLKSFIQSKLNLISSVKEKHEEQVSEYKMFCEFMEPKSVKEKLLSAIDKLESETRRLSVPDSDLVRHRDYLLNKRNKMQRKIDDQENKNMELRAKIELPED